MLSAIKDVSSPCASAVEFLQVLLICGCAWLAVRASIRPLIKLSREIEYLDPQNRLIRLDETGPLEIANAAAALNAMQDRVAIHLKEHLLILATISHDLQTPITRMRLRTEFMDESCEKEKLCHDLGEIEHLITEGVSYACSAQASSENNHRVDLNAFLETLVFDYEDMGKPIQHRIVGKHVLHTQPYVLRRLLVNLIDNAIKYGGGAQLEADSQVPGVILICILDRGPGIPESELERVLQPFYRIPSDRQNGTKGSGLGLAIANQLACVLGGQLKLSARAGGGLCVQVTLKSLAH
ncbi:ATP-binding protein [Pseudomonas abietaniphila]|jgi:signal transduction histidine kinase|nr:ATP-binding protein [Pseudomonas abietaniphila]